MICGGEWRPGRGQEKERDCQEDILLLHNVYIFSACGFSLGEAVTRVNEC